VHFHSSTILHTGRAARRQSTLSVQRLGARRRTSRRTGRDDAP
jgi:hypothetical protein